MSQASGSGGPRDQASSSGRDRPRDQVSRGGRDGPGDQASGSGDRAPGRAVFPVNGSDVTHDGVMVRIRVDRVAMPDGSVAAREVAQRPDAVAVVPLTDDGQVVMVRQYRHPVGGYELEIPAGLLDVDGEPEDKAAQRELAEEIGMRAGRLRRLTRFWNSAGWSDEATTVFLGTHLRPATPDEGFVAKAEEADMEVLRLPLRDALDRVRDGRITDAKTVIGLLLVAPGEGERSEPVGGDRLGEGERSEPVGGDRLGEGERSEPVGGDRLGEGERSEPVGGDRLGEGERSEPVGGDRLGEGERSEPVGGDERGERRTGSDAASS